MTVGVASMLTPNIAQTAQPESQTKTNTNNNSQSINYEAKNMSKEIFVEKENNELKKKIKKKIEEKEVEKEEKVISKEESKIVQEIPTGVILIWDEEQGYIIPQYQMATLDEIEAELLAMKEVYNDSQGNEN